MAFRQCFLRPPELTKIVLPKVLQNFKFHLLAQGTEPKSFPHNIECRTRPKGPSFQFFFGIARRFRKIFFSAVEENTLKLDVLLLFLSLGYGADLGRSRLVDIEDALVNPRFATAGDGRIHSILLATSLSLGNLLLFDLKTPNAVMLVCKHASSSNRVPFLLTLKLTQNIKNNKPGSRRHI